MSKTTNTTTKRRRRRNIDRTGLPFIGYIRVSSAGQVEGTSLESQERALRAWAEARGVEINVMRDEGRSGARMINRPGLMAAVAEVVDGHAAGIVISRLDRLGRNMAETLTLADRAKSEGWRIVALDVGLDTDTAAGAMVLGVMAAAAEYERMRISERQLEKHRALRRAGAPRGRAAADRELADRIIAMRDVGMSYRVIGAELEAAGIPTTRGGTSWHAATVRSIEYTRLMEIEAQAAA